MSELLMPKATAVWLVENTTLTFDQIAAFCGLHELEIQAVADGEVAVGMQGLDPVASGQLTREEVERCEGDPSARLKMAKTDLPRPKARSKGARYTPVSKRSERPDAIAWLLRSHPELTDAQICRLVGTTKPTIDKVRDRTHWNAANIAAQSPVVLGLCSQRELTAAVTRALKRAGKPLPQSPEPPKFEPRRPTPEEGEDVAEGEEGAAPAGAPPARDPDLTFGN